jgi:hypothetical protein
MPESFAGLRQAFTLLLERRKNTSERTASKVQVGTLLRAGLTKADLSLLLQNGYLEIIEDDPVIARARRLPSRQTAWPGSAQVGLTAPGAALAGQILFPLSDDQKRKRGFPDLTLPATPSWDEQQGILSWDDKVIERFRRPAPNLLALIHALSKSNWAGWTPNPFRSTAKRSAQSLLHDTIKNWNKSPMSKFIRLHGDGSGTGFLWERLV